MAPKQSFIKKKGESIVKKKESAVSPRQCTRSQISEKDSKNAWIGLRIPSNDADEEILKKIPNWKKG